MGNKYNVITLCGSTKFKEDFVRIQKELTLKGNIVLNLSIFTHSGDENVLNDDVKKMLKDMQQEKILMSDEIFVINKDNYIGESTKNEIEFAKKNNKKVTYMQ